MQDQRADYWAKEPKRSCYAPATSSPRVTHWWQKPRLRRDEDEGIERKVGFLDLFYDLIFVVVVAQVAHDLAKHPELAHLPQYAIAFTAVWWLWIGNTFYTDRFETQDVSHRFFTFLQMMPVVGLAVFAHDAFGHTALPFAVSYCVGRLLLIYLWWRGGRYDAEAKPATNGYVTGFTLGILPWVVSFFAPDDLRPWLWALGLLIDLATPAMMKQKVLQLPKFSHSRLAERFGLFTIIVLGESVAGTVNGLAGLDEVTARDQLAGFLAMLLAFELWWIYFEMVPRERIKQSFYATLGRSYAHLPLLGAIAASGAGVLSVVGHGDDPLGLPQRLLLGGSLAIAMLSMVALSRVHDYHPLFVTARRRTEGSLIMVAVGAIIFAWAGEGLVPVQWLVGLVTLTMVPILWGAWHWARMDPAAFESEVN